MSTDPRRTDLPPHERALTAAVAEHCEMGSWMAAQAGLARLGRPEPLDVVDWLRQAPMSEQVEAQRLLRLMSRHQWRLTPLPTFPLDPRERLHLALSVQGLRWHVALSHPPGVRALIVDPHPDTLR